MNLLNLFHWRRTPPASITFRMCAPARCETTHQITSFPTVMGRSDQTELQLPDRLASRVHCVLRHHGNRFLLRDLESRHGTWVNGVRINEQELAVGDEIWLGTTQLIVEAIAAPNCSTLT